MSKCLYFIKRPGNITMQRMNNILNAKGKYIYLLYLVVNGYLWDKIENSNFMLNIYYTG